MSWVQKRVVSTLKDVESQIRCSKCVFDENLPLSKKNLAFIHDLYVVMACIWYDASQQPALVSKRWVTALCSKPVRTVVDLFKSADDLLIKRKFSDYGSFKRYLQVYPDSGMILSPLKGNLQHFYDTGEGLPQLRTCLRFATRANFPDPIGLEEEAFDAWCSTNLTPWNEVNVEREAEILRGIFPRRKSVLQFDDFVGRFGPGASSDCANNSLLEKYQQFGSDPLLNFASKELAFKPSDMPLVRDKDIRTGKLLFVPKWLDKLRTVSIEPCSLMFYQLGIAKCMLLTIAKTPWRRHIDLAKADLNQDLAWLGSLDGEYATIDLSSASDLVKKDLVKRLFAQTSLRTLLLATRSRRVEYQGQLLDPEYFAPMGSGLCFPVECCVFAAVVDAVMHRERDRRAWRVYGDDIIVPTNRYDAVVTRLEQLGFQVNPDKSYAGPAGFRESCGGDYMFGEDVRPIYVSRFWEGLPKSTRCRPSMIESCIDLANRLVHYKQARLRVIESLLLVRPRVLFGSDGESGIFSTEATNYRAKARWNEAYQRNEYYTGLTKVRSEKDKLEHEHLRYFETLRAMAERPACAERMPISISPSAPPIWGGAWRSPAPGWH